MYLNKAFVIGNLTRDPELRSLPSGIKVASFAVATNRVWKDQSGERKEAVDYHNIVVFGRQAETVSQYLRKGSSALVEGRMQTRSWDAPDGQKKYRMEIVADRVQFGERRGGGGVTGQVAADKSDKSAGTDAGAAKPPVDAIEYPEEEIKAEDIPF